MRDRSFANAVAEQHYQRHRPSAWFDTLYTEARGDTERIPWAESLPNPNLIEWLKREQPPAGGRAAAVVGCGLGQDAEALANYGFHVTAFDISPTAIDWAKRRWPASTVNYVCADLFNVPAEWNRAFDFVLESYTVQALPPEIRPQTVEAVASLVSNHGRLLLVARARHEQDSPGNLPWPLTEREVRLFETHGLRMLRLEDYMDQEDPPERRWRALLERTVE